MDENKILIVNDSKTINSAIKQLAEGNYPFTPYYAVTSEEVHSLIEDHRFFAAILDLEFPDPQNEALIDYVIDRQISTIVLTSTFNESLRRQILSKSIVDYIVKNSMDDIKHALDIAQNLLYFREKTAMIVDDSPVARILLSELFEMLSFRIIEAENGIDALQKLSEHNVDIMTIDYHMPGMDGIELIRHIRNTPVIRQPLIFAVTSNESVLNKARFIKSGANDYFSKPVQKEEFNHKLGNFFQILHQQEALMRSQKRLEEEQKRHNAYMKTLFDKNPNIVIVANSDGVVNMNEKFFAYFSQYGSVEQFKERHTCICELFEKVDEEHFLQPRQREWIKYGMENPNSQALIKNGDIEYYFSVNSDEIHFDDEMYYIVTFTDISRTYLLQKKFEEYSMIDNLTHIYNRRFFNQIFEREIQRAHRERKHFTFMIIDVDHFKNYNDTYGHDEGDNALRGVSATIKGQLKRSSDYLFRLGGEEFGVIVVDQDPASSHEHAEKIRHAIAELNLPHVNNFGYDRVTVSIGFETIDFAFDDLPSKQIFRNADQALYDAKRAGRNRVFQYVSQQYGSYANV